MSLSHSKKLLSTAEENITKDIENLKLPSACPITNPTVRPQISPIPLHVLKEKDDESWLSGSELRTDNSSSDDDASTTFFSNESRSSRKKRPIKQKTLGGAKSLLFPKKTLSYGMDIDSFESCYQDKENENDEEKEVDSTTTALLASSTTECSSNTSILRSDPLEWRPKRGSITLPTLLL